MQYQAIAIVPDVALPYSSQVASQPNHSKRTEATQQQQQQNAITSPLELKSLPPLTSLSSIPPEDGDKSEMTYCSSFFLLSRPEKLAAFNTRRTLVGMLINLLRQQQPMKLADVW